MKLRLIGTVALSALALTAISAGTASATTLEVEGATQNSEVEISATLGAGSTFVMSSTSGALSGTCTESAFAGNSAAPFTGTKVTGAFTELSFSSCHQEKIVVDTLGNFYVEWTANTTGTLFWEETVITIPTTANPKTPLKCVTGEGRKIGTVHGVANGKATIIVNTVIDCGFLLPTAKWTGEYTITSPTGLGVSQ